MNLFESLKKYRDYSTGISNEACELKYLDTNFDNIIFDDYDLNNSYFLEDIFFKCSFKNVYLSGSSLCGSTFKECYFEDNIFKKGNADHTEFYKTNFKNMDAFRTSFYETNFEDVKIFDSFIRNCHIGYAKFTNVIFENTNLTKTNFNGSNFNDVIFNNCYFEETQFKNIIGSEKIKFYKSKVLVNGILKTNIDDIFNL